ncbi:sigma-70 family RNA polymerase sigma factor [Kutzneria sp. NPDC052558]|uniref:sigma-70 family RNA polymerase sigma factor n=1 Tax=Kutzneria sp. NPDC052558 TaxID=3364121 RepID=UPI0037CA9A70
MATAPLDAPGPSDAELIDSVRGGDTAAYGSLYERHVGAAYNLARQLTRSTAEADDLVAEAFAKVLDTLRDGRGPDSAFRAYLLTALRHTAYDKTRRDRKLELAEDVTEVASPEAISVQFSDTAVSGLERSLAAKAFARLPERWQAVLWHTEIEGMSPADVAPILGLTANGVSALAYRAREGLRQAYLQVHLAESTADRCRATVDRLGAWTRGGLSKRETAQVETHLDECERCRALAAELADVNGALRAVVAPLVLGIGAAGYLATIGASTAKAATVLAAGSAAGAAGGAAGAASSVPRQMIGVGASAAALAVVVALALTAGQTKPVTATAAPPPPPPPATTAPATPSTPTQTPTPTTTPTTPTTTSPSSPPPAAPPPPTTTTTTTTAPKADLVPSVPGQPISLVPGGPAVELPVTVTNNGNGTSEPVTAMLNLPAGVTAAPGGTQSFAQRDLLAADDKQTISCTGGTGTISCTTGIGLAPAESVTFRFELSAGPDATGGQITGSIVAGGGMAIQLTSVDVQVRQIDDLDLSAQVWRHDYWTPRVDVSVTNRSTHAGAATVTVNAPRDGWLFTLAPCQQDGEQINCKFDLDRGQTVRFGVWVFRWHHRDDALTVAASLGSAHKVIDVPLDCDPGTGELPPMPLPGVPVTTPTTTLPTIPSTTTSTTPPPTTKSEPPARTTTPEPPARTTTEPPPPVETPTTTTPAPTTTTSPPSSTPPPGPSDPGGGLCLPLLDPRWPFC